MTYAFTFDAAFCSGCKACQAACKDKNNLPLGVLWRRVIEVTGGAWQRRGEAWNNTVFAYNLSISCNHCLHPKCAGVCPTDAYLIREDGIVLLDTTKCMGCGYCAWACPYGAPQYNADAGTMTKCNFCLDDLEQGLPPACVAACPMRVLDCRETTGTAGNELRLWDAPPETHPYPLSPDSHSQPRLAIKLHAAMNRPDEKTVANLEEIQPRKPSAREELPLMLFTLFTQVAVGGFWALLWMFPDVWVPANDKKNLLQLLPFLLIGLCLGAGMLASLAHLGTKKNAWRALTHLRKSWLSREILFAGLFGTGWLFSLLQVALGDRASLEVMALTATFGLGLVYSMSRVYRLPAVPVWNTWQTNVGFIISALLLGQSVVAVLLSSELNITSIGMPSSQRILIGGSILSLLVAQLALMYKRGSQSTLQTIRIALILAGVTANIIGLLLPNLDVTWLSALIALLVLAEEGLGRWLFYQSRANHQ